VQKFVFLAPKILAPLSKNTCPSRQYFFEIGVGVEAQAVSTAVISSINPISRQFGRALRWVGITLITPDT
jgi:hypothetical protein